MLAGRTNSRYMSRLYTMIERNRFATIEDILKHCRTIAVVGVGNSLQDYSYRVARYLRENGYQVVLVNPRYKVIQGETSYPNLLRVPRLVDMVDIFPVPREVFPVVEQAIIIGARVIWMQKGIVDPAAVSRASRAGLEVIMDECIMEQHKALMQKSTAQQVSVQ